MHTTPGSLPVAESVGIGVGDSEGFSNRVTGTIKSGIDMPCSAGGTARRPASKAYSPSIRRAAGKAMPDPPFYHQLGVTSPDAYPAPKALARTVSLVMDMSDDNRLKRYPPA